MFEWTERRVSFFAALITILTTAYGNLGDEVPLIYAAASGSLIGYLIYRIFIDHSTVKKVNLFAGKVEFAKYLMLLEVIKILKMDNKERALEEERLIKELHSDLGKFNIKSGDL